MPCPHFDVSIAQRSNGDSALESAAYISGSRLFYDYEQAVKDYSLKQREVFHEEIMLPENAPPEYRDRQTLWNAAEAVEKQWNSQLARKLNMALPRELPMEENLQMVREYCQQNFVSKGMCCDFAIHDKHDGNPHVHIMLTLRSMDENGRWRPKARKEYVLDERGERIRLPSGNFKTRKANTNDWNDPGNCAKWRQSWEDIQNRFLEKNGRPERVSLKSYDKQGIDQVPTVHMGPADAHLEAKGIRTNLGDLNRDIVKTNRMLRSIREAIRSIRSWLFDLNEKRQILMEALAKLKEPTIAELLSDYYQIRSDERETWSSGARLKGTVSDYERLTACVIFLKKHKLVTLEDLRGKVDQLEADFKTIHSEGRAKERRIRDIDALLSASDTVKRLKPIHDTYIKKNFKRSKEKYAVEYADELKSYNIAYRTIMKLNDGKPQVDIPSLRAEKTKLEKELQAAALQMEMLQAELNQMNSIRYYVSRALPEDEAARIRPEGKISLHDRMTAERLHDDKKNEGRAQDPPARKQNIEHE